MHKKDSDKKLATHHHCNRTSVPIYTLYKLLKKNQLILYFDI